MHQTRASQGGRVAAAVCKYLGTCTYWLTSLPQVPATCLVVGAAPLAIGIEVWAIVSWLFGLALGVVAAVLRVTVLPRVIGPLAAVASGISAAALVGRILGGH